MSELLNFYPPSPSPPPPKKKSRGNHSASDAFRIVKVNSLNILNEIWWSFTHRFLKIFATLLDPVLLPIEIRDEIVKTIESINWFHLSNIQLHRDIQRVLSGYQDEKRGPTMVLVHAQEGLYWMYLVVILCTRRR